MIGDNYDANSYNSPDVSNLNHNYCYIKIKKGEQRSLFHSQGRFQIQCKVKILTRL